MASFAGAVMRLAFSRKPKEGQYDEEQGPVQHHGPIPGMPAMFGGQATSSTHLDGHHPPSVVAAGQGGSYRIREDDPLTLFRLMIGITSSPFLGFARSSPMGRRPAANIGIYSRIVAAEQQAHDSFEIYNIVINGCYFLQIVVAAALTAMGAASASSKAITAFAALNTVMAGLLTFLKGSGLPGRLKYYENQWKEIREFIEQRERDFSRAGCTLNVYKVVEDIEKMYEETKSDIEQNTPEGYHAGNQRVKNNDSEKVAGIDVSKIEDLHRRLSTLDMKTATDTAKNATDSAKDAANGAAGEVEKKKHGILQSLTSHKDEIIGGIRSVQKAAQHQVEEHKARAQGTIDHSRAQVERELDEKADHVHARLQEVDEHKNRAQKAIDQGRSRVATEIDDTSMRLRSMADRSRLQFEKEVEEQRRRMEHEAGQRRTLFEKNVDEQRSRLEREASEHRAELEKKVEEGSSTVQKGANDAVQSASDAKDQAAAAGEKAAQDTRSTIASHIRGAADDVEAGKKPEA